MNLSEKELDFLYAHLTDLYGRSESGQLCVSRFYSPAELVYVRRWLSRACARERAVIFGGYTDSERARVYFLPDYIQSDGKACVSAVLRDYGYDDPTVMLRISASGFRSLTHRDFMGSVLALGIDRDVIGDIVCDGDFCAYVFCDDGISSYIRESLVKAANDSVKVTLAEPVSESFLQRHFDVIHETVASCRLDGVIAAVCNVSRDAAKKLVTSGLCELNYESVTSADRELGDGDIFSARGFGKYKFVSCDGENRRGRLRITVHKYI